MVLPLEATAENAGALKRRRSSISSTAPLFRSRRARSNADPGRLSGCARLDCMAGVGSYPVRIGRVCERRPSPTAPNVSPGSMADVLIVEDDPDIREDLAELLRARGYAVSTASNGREALDALSDGEHPRVILLDLMMPV